MTTLLHDLRFGIRSLWRQKTLSLAAIATLGVCIAAATTIFSIVNAVVLRPLPFPQPDRLAFLYNSYPRAGVDVAGSGVPDYYDCLEEKGLFEEVASFRSRGQTIGAGGDAERRTMMTMTPSLFRLLQVKPLIGRAFVEEDAEVGNEHKIILGYELWQRLMGGSASAIGRDVRINEVPYTVVGVMPAGFQFWSADIAAWIPAAFSARDRSDEARHCNNQQMVARLKPGVRPRTRAATDRRPRQEEPRTPARHQADSHRRRVPDIRAAAPGVPGARCPGHAVSAVGRVALRAPDRLRQHREPGAGQGQRADEGTRHPVRARRDPRAPGPPDRDRGGDCRRRRRRAWFRAGPVGVGAGAHAGARAPSARIRDRVRCAGHALHAGARGRHQRVRRAGPDGRPPPARAGAGRSGRGPVGDRQPRRADGAAGPRHGAGRACARAPRRGGPAVRELPEAAGAGPGVQGGAGLDRCPEPADRPLQQRPEHRGVPGAAARAAEGGAWGGGGRPHRHHPVRPRHERQRDLRRGVHPEARRVVHQRLPDACHPGLLRSNRHQAHPRTTLRGAGRGRVAPRDHRRRPDGRPLLARRRPDRQADVAARRRAGAAADRRRAVLHMWSG